MVNFTFIYVRTWSYRLLLIISGMIMNPACAIDNPDSPDLIAEFGSREQPYLININNPDNGSRDILLAHDSYLNFLDSELNNAYKLIKTKLPTERQQELKNSQVNWIKFREAEFELIKNNWTTQNFGSSASISRGNYRSTVIRNRVLQLLHYAKNY